MKLRTIYFILFILFAAALYDTVNFVTDRVKKHRLNKGKKNFRNKRALILNATTSDGQAISTELAKRGVKLCITSDDSEALRIFDTLLRKRLGSLESIVTAGKTTEQLVQEISKISENNEIGIIVVCQRVDGSWCNIEPLEIIKSLDAKHNTETEEKNKKPKTNMIPLVTVVHPSSVLGCENIENPTKEQEAICMEGKNLVKFVEDNKRGVVYVYGLGEDIERTGEKAVREELTKPNRTDIREVVDNLFMGKHETLYEYENVMSLRKKNKKHRKNE